MLVSNDVLVALLLLDFRSFLAGVIAVLWFTM